MTAKNATLYAIAPAGYLSRGAFGTLVVRCHACHTTDCPRVSSSPFYATCLAAQRTR